MLIHLRMRQSLAESTKSLANEVIKLCAEAMPEMDIKAFSSVAQVMTAKELLSFKEAFTKKTVKAPLIFKLKVMTQKQIIQ